MAYQSKDLSVLAYANGFTSWHYITADAPTDLIAPGYFNGAADLMRAGDLLTINAGYGAAPANFMLSVTSNSNGVPVVAPLWTPPAAKAGGEWAGHAAGFAALNAASETADDLTEAAKLIAWEMRARLSVEYRAKDCADCDALWNALVKPDRDACVSAASAALSSATSTAAEG